MGNLSRIASRRFIRISLKYRLRHTISHARFSYTTIDIFLGAVQTADTLPYKANSTRHATERIKRDVHAPMHTLRARDLPIFERHHTKM